MSDMKPTTADPPSDLPEELEFLVTMRDTGFWEDDTRQAPYLKRRWPIWAHLAWFYPPCDQDQLVALVLRVAADPEKIAAIEAFWELRGGWVNVGDWTDDVADLTAFLALL